MRLNENRRTGKTLRWPKKLTYGLEEGRLKARHEILKLEIIVQVP